VVVSLDRKRLGAKVWLPRRFRQGDSEEVAGVCGGRGRLPMEGVRAQNNVHGVDEAVTIFDNNPCETLPTLRLSSVDLLA
jgi:hypothetical protein